MQSISQDPHDPTFIQNPYPFYSKARAAGPLVYWEEYEMVMATRHSAVWQVLRDRNLGREVPKDLAPEIPERLAPFYDLEAHSMLEADPPRHTRLRSLCTRAFTSGRIAPFTEVINQTIASLTAAFPDRPFDLIEHFARPLPIQVICRLLGVPTERADDLLDWSNAMVGMYQAGRTREMEDAAVNASIEMRAYVEEVIAERRKSLGDDLLSDLISAEEEGARLSPAELVSTVILLLNAGHEATVHSLGNAIKTILETGTVKEAADAQGERTDRLVEEVLRFDPPLHIFHRIARKDTEVFGVSLARGQKIGSLLASANRDDRVYEDPDAFKPNRLAKQHMAFGAGLHFCIGAPLARLELSRALPALFKARPKMALTRTPQYAPVYHFHGLKALEVTA